MSCCGGNCGCGAGCKCGSGCGGCKMCPDVAVETARTETLIMGIAPQKENAHPKIHSDVAEGSAGAGAENGCCKCKPCICHPCNC